MHTQQLIEWYSHGRFGPLQGMQLKRNETLVGMSILSASATSAAAAEGAASPTVLLVTAQGLGKRVPAEAFPLQRRAGMGNIAIKCNPGDRLVALHVVGALASGPLLPSTHMWYYDTGGRNKSCLPFQKPLYTLL